MNTAIIVAAGQGSRFAASRPKQFLDLAGKPVILHTVERFAECAAIDSIVVVLPAEGFEEFQGFIAAAGQRKLAATVKGGPTRAESVRNGFSRVDQKDSGIVAVHDGARPLVTSDEIARTLLKASETGAACLAAEVTDTIKEVEGGLISRTIDRRSLMRALTPQCFRYDLLRRMLSLDLTDEAITDECFLAEKLGIPVSCVPGSSRNIKITHPADLRLAEMLLADEHGTEKL